MRKITIILIVLLAAVLPAFAHETSCSCKTCKANAEELFYQELKENVPPGFIVVRDDPRVLGTTVSKPILVNIDNIIKIRPITFKNECGYYAEIFTVDSTYQNDSRIYSVETYWEVLEMIAEAQKKADQ